MEEEKQEQQEQTEDQSPERGTGLTKLRAWATFPRIGAIALALILVAVLVAVVPHLRPSGTTTTQPEATDAALTDGRYIVTLSQVLDISGSGSLVQIFAAVTSEDGTVSYAPVEPLRYLEPCGAQDGTTTVYMSESQVRAYLALEGRCAAVVVGCGSQEAADKRLAWQSSYNDPTVRLTMTEATKTVAKGAKVQLGLDIQVTPEEAPYGSVVWASSDEAVAVVDDSGMVQGVMEGTATITATCGDLSASCTVTVQMLPDSVVLTPESLHLKVGDTGTVSTTVLPDSVTDKTVAWTSSNEAVATVDETGKITAIAAGQADITAICGGVSAVCPVVVE